MCSKSAWKNAWFPATLMVFFVVLEVMAAGYPRTARLLPQLVGAVGIILSAAYIASQLFRPAPEEKAEVRKPEARKKWNYTALSIPIYIVLLYLFGYLTSGLVLVAGLTWALGVRNFWVVLGTGVLATVALYLLFGSWLAVPLPKGLLFG